MAGQAIWACKGQNLPQSRQQITLGADETAELLAAPNGGESTNFTPFDRQIVYL